MMNDNDRQEIRAMIKDAVLTKEEIRSEIISPLMRVVSAGHEADLKVINQKLDQIITQTTKHNNRMDKIEGAAKDTNDKVIELEKSETAHVINCPHNDSIRKLQDDSLTSKGIKKWATGTVILASTIVGIFWMLSMWQNSKEDKNEQTTVHSSTRFADPSETVDHQTRTFYVA